MIKEKVKTGVPGLDDMLDGGLIPGRVYVVSGTSGTGKTTLGMQFLLEGIRAGERVIYVALDEPPNEVCCNMLSYGWDIGRIQVFDGTPDVMSYDKTPVRDVSTERRIVYFEDLSKDIRHTSDRSPVDMTVNTIQELLRQEMKVRRYSRVVVDSLTSLRYFYLRTSEESANLISFVRLLSDLGVTSLLTVHLPEVSKPDVEMHMSRGVIRLHKWIDGRGLMRGVTIEKYRGSPHDHTLRMMKIGSGGITVKSAVPEGRAPARQTRARQAKEEDEDPPPPDDIPAPQDSASDEQRPNDPHSGGGI